MLQQCGWGVQDKDSVNLGASPGVAVRELGFRRDHGLDDYALYVNRRLAGVIEAKREGTLLNAVAEQSACYYSNPNGLPFLYESTGVAESYTLREFVVASNHVHAILTPLMGYTLSSILHSWRSFTAHEIVKIEEACRRIKGAAESVDGSAPGRRTHNSERGRRGQYANAPSRRSSKTQTHVWQKESFCHIIRNPVRLEKFRAYIRNHQESGQSGRAVPAQENVQNVTESKGGIAPLNASKAANPPRAQKRDASATLPRPHSPFPGYTPRFTRNPRPQALRRMARHQSQSRCHFHLRPTRLATKNARLNRCLRSIEREHFKLTNEVGQICQAFGDQLDPLMEELSITLAE